jgi:hypothetical protein
MMKTLCVLMLGSLVLLAAGCGSDDKCTSACKKAQSCFPTANINCSNIVCNATCQAAADCFNANSCTTMMAACSAQMVACQGGTSDGSTGNKEATSGKYGCAAAFSCTMTSSTPDTCGNAINTTNGKTLWSNLGSCMTTACPTCPTDPKGTTCTSCYPGALSGTCLNQSAACQADK